MSFTTFLREMSFTTRRREMSFTSYWYNSSPGRVILVYLVGRPLYVGIPPRPARSRRITAWCDPMAVLSFRCSSAMLRGATLGSHFWIQSPSTDSWGLVCVGSRLRHWWNDLHEIILHPTRGGDPGVTFSRNFLPPPPFFHCDKTRCGRQPSMSPSIVSTFAGCIE